MLSLTLLNVLNTLILYLNIIFIVNSLTLLPSICFGFSKVSEGISGDLLALMRVHDVFYWLDTLSVCSFWYFTLLNSDGIIKSL